MYPTGTSPSAPSRPQRSQSSSTVARTRSTSPRRKLSCSGPAAEWSQRVRTALWEPEGGAGMKCSRVPAVPRPHPPTVLCVSLVSARGTLMGSWGPSPHRLILARAPALSRASALGLPDMVCTSLYFSSTCANYMTQPANQALLGPLCWGTAPPATHPAAPSKPRRLAPHIQSVVQSTGPAPAWACPLHPCIRSHWSS